MPGVRRLPLTANEIVPSAAQLRSVVEKFKIEVGDAVVRRKTPKSTVSKRMAAHA